ncbi:MAG: zinc ribbon domain-containing protein [Oscillospiraceae bacterium]|nr:zinc ribbon domain-containing protein [Oscillospiraceae bacterium]
MFCAKCGAENKDDSCFCESCGSNITPVKKSSVQPLNGAAANKKLVVVILAVLILLAAIILIPALKGGSEPADAEPGLQKSDIIGKWYSARSDTSRTVYVFTEGGVVRTWDEMGDFFNNGDDDEAGLLGGTWKIIGNDGILITYEESTNTVLERYFGESGLGGVVLDGNGKQIKFIIHGDNYDRLILQKYPVV